jgi:hypothetical protein
MTTQIWVKENRTWFLRGYTRSIGLPVFRFIADDNPYCIVKLSFDKNAHGISEGQPIYVYWRIQLDIWFISGMYNHWFNDQTYVLQKVTQFPDSLISLRFLMITPIVSSNFLLTKTHMAFRKVNQYMCIDAYNSIFKDNMNI